MNSGMITTVELAVAVPTSTIISSSVNADGLLTALISLAVSIVTLVGGELVKFLVAYFQKKTKELKGNETESEETDENKEVK